LSYVGLAWQFNLALLMVPAVLLAWLALRADFPVTERVANGLSYSHMLQALVRSPGFLVWLLCMMGTVTTELAPGQWVDLALTNVVGMPGIWVLVYVSALMFVMRHFAGPIVSRISSVGLLGFSCAAAACGLYFLAVADSPAAAFAAATVWGIGVCYLYPTMLGSVAERYPDGGAWFLGLMGFAGGMATQFLLPVMGGVFDTAKLEAAGGLERLQTLSGEGLAEVMRVASIESFQVVAVIPLALIPVFAVIGVSDMLRSRRRAAA
jgi:hypothetical protein